MTRIILAWAATALLCLACGGGSGGGGSLRQACTKICDCLEDTSSFSNSGGGNCVDQCVGSSSSGSFSSSGAELSPACLSCINTATCPDLLDGTACSVECN